MDQVKEDDEYDPYRPPSEKDNDLFADLIEKKGQSRDNSAFEYILTTKDTFGQSENERKLPKVGAF